MRIAVFGATGRIGRLVTEQLLGASHEVTALVRTPDKLTLDHPGLTVRTGQLSDAAAVRDVVAGSDAVISALGRFIGLATPSVPDPRDGATFKAKLLPLIAGVSFPNALTELRGMTAAVTDSELDWTLARITNPTDRPARGTVRAGFLGRDAVGWAMTRADIATFLVGQLTDTTYVRAAPAISN